MTLAQLYQAIVACGRKADPRPKKSKVTSYADTAVLYGDPSTRIKKVLVGIDIEVPELLLADRIRSREGLDLVISHHPEGKAFALLHKVMRLQAEILTQLGISRQAAESFLSERINEVERRLLPANHTRAVDAARLLRIPFLCVHTPADNHVFQYINRRLAAEKPKQLKDILSLLTAIPEYKEAARQGAGPKIVLGDPKRGVGKWIVEMTGGTEGPKDIYDSLYKKGIRTLVSMHLSEEHFKKVHELGMNVVIAGHISSDTLGMNLLLDAIEKISPLSITECSGFKRVCR